MLSPEAKSADFYSRFSEISASCFQKFCSTPSKHHHHHHQYIKLRSETLSVCLRRPQKSLSRLSRHSRVLPPLFPCPLLEDASQPEIDLDEESEDYYKDIDWERVIDLQQP